MANGDNARRIDDALSYPVITQEVDSSRRSGAPGTASGSQYAQMVQGALRDILGWRTRDNDPKGFMAALTQSFESTEVNGMTKWKWTPHTYAIQADLGAITGAQAALYARARVALDQSVPLIDGLRPLRPDADADDAEAARALVKSNLTEMVQQFSAEVGPLNTRVDGYFAMLLGEPDENDPDIPTSDSQLGLLRETFGLERSQVNTIAEEQNLTNFLLLVDYVNSLRLTWESQSSAFDRTGTDAFLGTQSVLLARELAVVAEAVQETYFVMDSVFLGQAERNITELELNIGGTDTRIFIGEMLNWIENFALEEGPRLIQQGGKDGVIHSFRPTINKLRELVQAAADASHNGSNDNANPTAAFHSVRVGRSLDELSHHLEKTAELADQIKRDAPPSINDVLVSESESSDGHTLTLFSVIGEDFKPGATLHLESTDADPGDEPIIPTKLFFMHETELKATFVRSDIVGDWLVVVTNPDGQFDESDTLTIADDNDDGSILPNSAQTSSKSRRVSSKRNRRA